MMNSMLASSLRRSLYNTSKRQLLHTIAVAREIPDSFESALSEHSKVPDPLAMEVARAQHAKYIQVLRRHVPVLMLPALEECPDCVFVEDTAVVVGNKAVITNPGHPTRRGEVESIKMVLKQLGLDLVDMRISDKAICDGGDVLYTGRHLFVGLSDRTNKAAAAVLDNAFDGVETVVVPAVIQGDQVLHLKSAVTHIDEHTLVVPTGAAGDAILEAMEAEERGYTAVRVPDFLACNVVAVNGCILVQDTECKESRETLKKAVEERNLKLEWVDSSELAKKDAALTCCSVLLSV
jgi:dimethylargininase